MLLAGPVVPYTRMTRRALWTDTAQRYLASQTALSLQMRAQMADHGWMMYPKGLPLQLRIAFGWCVHTHDLSNLLKAVEDAGIESSGPMIVGLIASRPAVSPGAISVLSCGSSH
jgi:hypothetical protein